MSDATTRRRHRAVVGSAGCVAALVLFVAGYAGAAIAATLLTAVIATAAAVGVARRTTGRSRVAWALVTAAVTVNAIGDAVWAGGRLVIAGGAPDALSHCLVTFPLFLLATAVAVHPASRRWHDRVSRTVVDGILLAGSTALVADVVAAHLGVRTTGTSAATTLAAEAYPVLAAVTLALFVMLLRRVVPSDRQSVGRGIVAALLVMLADAWCAHWLVHPVAGVSGLACLGWSAGYLMVFAAARSVPRLEDHAPAEAAPAVLLLLPYGAVAVAMLVAGADFTIDGTPGPYRFAVLASLVGALVVRQSLAMIDTLELSRALSSREEHFRTLVQGSNDLITVIDGRGRICWVSEGLGRVLGYGVAAVVGAEIADFVHPDDVPEISRRLRAHITSRIDDSLIIENRVRHADGSWRHVESVYSNHLDNPAVRGIVVNSRDISERKELEHRLTELAFCDELTGLANRVRLRDRVQAALDSAARESTDCVALLFIDLDGFKAVNDSLGHASGDIVIREAARRLTDALRPEDTVARLGGDEFAVLLDWPAGRRHALEVANRLLEKLQAAYQIGDTEMVINASVGVALGRKGDDAELLVRDADLAMYRAKGAGKGRVEFFRPEMYATVLRRVELERDLRAAIERDELEVVYQPVVDLTNGMPVSVEALLRWQSEQRGHVGPLDFVPFAEDSGLIVPIGRWVLEQACRQVARWRRSGIDVRLCVNVSARQLQSPRLVESVASTLRAHSLDARHLTIELTESVLIDDADRTLGKLHLLRELGVGLAVDDFGTGWSSLSYLRRLPVDTVKVDRSFVAGLGEDSDLEALTRAIVRLAADLGMSLIAEGVETIEQAARLRAMGARLAQGWLFAKAGSAGDIGRLLASGDPLASAFVLRSIAAGETARAAGGSA